MKFLMEENHFDLSNPIKTIVIHLLKKAGAVVA